MNIQVIEGPNLNLLGHREPEIYGKDTLEELHAWMQNQEYSRPCVFRFFQSNSEGALIDAIQQCVPWARGLVINPAAYTHTSYAIRDAIAAIGIPAVEVHLSDIHRREPFRAQSVIVPVCVGQVYGKGKESYREGVEILLAL
ncbi:MAG: type II 3-dehydroquinate dehydratase [Candidatus Neomarinimicrobiota bacterium]|nr:MAG: type II 3-dehydroquinate dehydratase [Candidatus Neomarinimicrobiota bacterium]